MSRLKELIDELCPDGVEYKSLSELASIRGRIGFRGYKRSDLVISGGAYTFSPADIVNGKLFTSCAKRISMDKYVESPEIQVSVGDVLIAKTASIGKVAAVRMLDDVATINPQLVVLKDISCDYLYLTYVLQSNPIQRELSRIACGAIPNISQKNLGLVCIPVPPIEVQREIVRILDSFQELDDALTAEIEARERQFEWMLQEELSISHLARVESNAVEMRAVRDIREKVITPIRAKPADFEGTIPWCKLEDVVGYEIGDSLSGKNVSEETVVSMGLNVYPEGTVLCSCSATLGVYCVTQKPLVTNQRFMGFICSDEVLNRFFMYAMDASTTKLLMQATTGTNAYISRKAFEDHLIPVPTIGVQKRVVEELDSAYHLLNSLRSMREARRKQFAYYRDKLLSFPEKVTVNG